MAPPLPLVIDLDDTLVRTDTLLEQLVFVAFKAPQRLPQAFAALFRGRAVFKRTVAEIANLDVAVLPYNEAIVAHAAERRAEGGAVHLVTAADQSIADKVAAHLGIFETAQGSDGQTNLKGARKAEAIAARFPDGFAYAGDCGADVHIWRRAAEILVVGGGSGLRARLTRENLELRHDFPSAASGPRTWAKALRVHQWAKNAVILVPLFLSQQYADPSVLVRALIGFLVFNLVASSTYVLNDLSDLAADRAHPTKRRRPIAAGAVHIRSALPLALTLLIGGVAASVWLSPAFGAATLAYVVTTLLYSFFLKAQPLIDVMTIGGLFTLRVVAGMLLIATPISLWLSTFAFLLFTSLALAKRHGELARAQVQGRTVVGRGYLSSDTLVTAPLGVSSGVTAVLVMVLYMELEARMTGLYPRVEPLFLIPAVLAAWILRIWLRAHRGTLHDDPVVFALKDRVSWGHAGAVVLLWLASTL